MAFRVRGWLTDLAPRPVLLSCPYPVGECARWQAEPYRRARSGKSRPREEPLKQPLKLSSGAFLKDRRSASVVSRSSPHRRNPRRRVRRIGYRAQLDVDQIVAISSFQTELHITAKLQEFNALEWRRIYLAFARLRVWVAREFGSLPIEIYFTVSAVYIDVPCCYWAEITWWIIGIIRIGNVRSLPGKVDKWIGAGRATAILQNRERSVFVLQCVPAVRTRGRISRIRRTYSSPA